MASGVHSFWYKYTSGVDVHQVVNDPVHHDHFCRLASGFKRWPTELVHYCSNTAGVSVVACAEAGISSLDRLQFVDVESGFSDPKRMPHTQAGVLQEMCMPLP